MKCVYTTNFKDAKRDHRTMKKAVEKILYKRKRNKGKGFNTLLIETIKTTMVNNLLLASGRKYLGWKKL